jgi:hypothetical protein
MQMMGTMHEMMQPGTAAMTGPMPMTGTMPMTAQTMPRMMQMMGMMMQMMGMMEQMKEHGMFMMGAARPLTGTMPMTGAVPMGQGMAPGMMDMMNNMGQMMAQMQGMMGGTTPMTGTMPMGQGRSAGMMGMMGEMSQMIGMMQAMMGSTLPMTSTAPLSGTTSAALLEPPQTAQAGAIEIKLTPTNLQDATAETIDFAVELNSHSQEINLDLAKTAKLRIGAEEVTPLAWETASPQGHHVAGVLRFARADESGKPLLTDAAELSLVIGGLPDEAERTFTWQVNPQ